MKQLNNQFVLYLKVFSISIGLLLAPFLLYVFIAGVLFFLERFTT